MADKCIKEIKKGSLVIFRQAFGLDIEKYLDVLKVFTEIFGPYGIIISDIYFDEEESEMVADVWFPANIIFYAVPLDRLRCL
mgnify:CR=1 FL=1